MARHTPGPWQHWGNGYVRWLGARNRAGKRTHSVVCSVSSPGANDLLTLTGGYGNYGQAKEIQAANAALVAAAPDLLAALTAIRDAWRSIPETAPVPEEINADILWEAADAAIAKALDGEPIPDVFADAID